MIGKNHKYSLVTLIERKTGYALVRKVKSQNSAGVATAIIQALSSLGSFVRTITVDNGLEFFYHAQIAAATGAKIQFADPCSSWQRGTNENCYGLLRQYYPKKNAFCTYRSEHLCPREAVLNNRAQEKLACRTPLEAIMP